MLDTNMNLLATLGPVIPAPPLGLGQGGGGSGQPRFDALLLELSKSANVSGKPKEGIQVSNEVKAALRGLLLEVADASPPEVVALSKSPPRQQALIDQVVQETNLQDGEERTLGQLFQAALQVVAQSLQNPATGAKGTQTQATTGGNPGPKGGTPVIVPQASSQAFEGGLASASRDASDAPEGKYVRVVQGLEVGKSTSTPSPQTSQPQVPQSNIDASGGELGALKAAAHSQSQAAAQTGLATAPAPKPSGGAPVVPGGSEPASPVRSDVPVQAPNAVAQNSRGKAVPAVNNTPAGNPPVESFLNQSQVVVQSVPAAQQAAAAVRPSRNSGEGSPEPQGPAKPATAVNASAPVPLGKGDPIAVAPRQRVITIPVSNNATIPVQGESKAENRPSITPDNAAPANTAKPNSQVPATQGNPTYSDSAQPNLNTGKPAATVAQGNTPLPDAPRVTVEGPQPLPQIQQGSKVVLTPQTQAPVAPANSGVQPTPANANTAVPLEPQSVPAPQVPAAGNGNAGQPAVVATRPSSEGANQPVPTAQNGPNPAQAPAGNTPSIQPEVANRPSVQQNRQIGFENGDAKRGGESNESGNRSSSVGNQQTTQPVFADVAFSAKSIGDLADSVVKDYQLRETVLKQVTAHLDQLEKGTSQLRIELEPKQLGKLEIALTSHEGRLIARLVASNAEVRDVIAANLQQFQDSLQQRGIQVQELSVAVRADVNSQSQGRAFENQAWMFNRFSGGDNQNEDSEPQLQWPAAAFDGPNASQFSVLA